MIRLFICLLFVCGSLLGLYSNNFIDSRDFKVSQICDSIDDEYLDGKRVLMLGEPVHGIKNSMPFFLKFIDELERRVGVDVVLLEKSGLFGNNRSCDLLTGSNCDDLFQVYINEKDTHYIWGDYATLFKYISNKIGTIDFYGFDIIDNENLISEYLHAIESVEFPIDVRSKLQFLKKLHLRYLDNTHDLSLIDSLVTQGLSVVNLIDSHKESLSVDQIWLNELARLNLGTLSIRYIFEPKEFLLRREKIISKYIYFLVNVKFKNERIVILSSNFHVMKKEVGKRDFFWNAKSFGSDLYDKNSKEVGSIALFFYRGSSGIRINRKNGEFFARSKKSLEYFLLNNQGDNKFYKLGSHQGKVHTAYPFAKKIQNRNWNEWFDYVYFEEEAFPDKIIRADELRRIICDN